MQQYQHIFFMDIETVPLTDNYKSMSERMQKEWEKKSRFLMRDALPDTTYEDLFIDKAGVYSEFAKVVCISFGSFQNIDGAWKMKLKSITSDNEQQLLTDFADVVTRFKDYSSRMAFCGHNIKEFDIPFLCRRMLINNIALPSVMNMAGMKPWENPHLDTLELWKFGDYKNYTSLALLAEILGIPSPKDDIDGSMVAHVYYKEKNLDRIARYCVQDVATSAKVFLRLKGAPSDFETLVIEEN